MPFISLGLSPSFVPVLEKLHYTTPFPIQEAAIPAILNQKDVLGIAQTGSGKTASYVLPLLMNTQGRISKKNRHVNVLVVVPTRELAQQVKDTFSLFDEALSHPIKTLAVYGGFSINPQMMALQGTNILVATPGRLLDLIDSNAVQVSEIDTLVLDEADKMLNMGFEEELSRILNLLPRKRQNLLFSATLSKDVRQMRKLMLNQPVLIQIEAEQENLDLIEQSAYLIADEKKGPLLRYIIQEKQFRQVLVFVSSIKKATNVAEKLRRNGVQAAAIHGQKRQRARADALHKFKTGQLRVLVATDLLARGIDIDRLPCVINYELPRSPKDYIHRIGRTGRAAAHGEAITLVGPDEQHHFKVIQKKMGKWVTHVACENLNLQGY